MKNSRGFSTGTLLSVLVWLFAILISTNSIFAEEAFHRTAAQKGVKTSTDVILVAMPVATLAGVLIERDWQGLKQGALTAVTTVGATYILKYAVKERRPDGSNWHSFPSGHTSSTFATATFLQRRYGWKVGVPAYALATYVGWGRVFSKRHHWWDVAVGAAIGAGSALIYTRPFAKKHDLEINACPYDGGCCMSASITF